MNGDSLSRIGLVISAIWLIIVLIRLGLYSSLFVSTPEGQLFSTVLNVFLIIGIVLIVLIFGRGAVDYLAAKAGKGTHCQQCYAKLVPGEEFCPKCGRRTREDRDRISTVER